MIPSVTIRLFGLYPISSRDLAGYSNASQPMAFNVPANKQLVIESIAALATTPHGQSPLLQLEAEDNKKATLFWMPLALQKQMSAKPRPGSSQPNVLLDWFAMNHALRAYVPAGGIIRLFGDRGPTTTHEGGVEVTISGYYEDVP